MDVVSTDLLLLHHLALWESAEDGLGEKPLLAYEDIDKLTGTGYRDTEPCSITITLSIIYIHI